MLTLYDINANSLADAELHMATINDVLKEVKQIQTFEKDLNNILDEVKEHIHKLNPVLRLTANDAEAILKMLRILLHTDRLLPLSSTSLGLTNLLYLALYLLDVEQREKIQTPIDGNEFELIIPAIEEPEAHLHPHVQRLLFKKFMRRNSSLILSTHSPHIASVAPLNSFLMFRKEASGQETLVSSTANLKNDLSPNEFEDIARYLDVTRAELLFSRAVIFVEGDAEEYLLPALAHIAGINLDRYGITICNIRGTNFAPFVKLVSYKKDAVGKSSGLGIPFVILTDGDKYVDQKQKAISWAKETGNYNENDLSQLKKRLEMTSKVKLYSRIEELDIPISFYSGLNRAISLLEFIDIDATTEASTIQAYREQAWNNVLKT